MLPPEGLSSSLSFAVTIATMRFCYPCVPAFFIMDVVSRTPPSAGVPHATNVAACFVRHLSRCIGGGAGEPGIDPLLAARSAREHSAQGGLARDRAQAVLRRAQGRQGPHLGE